jgi:hypothetical protein
MAARGPLLLIVLPLVLAACGGGGSKAVSGDPLAVAARHTLAQGSEKVSLQAKVDLGGQNISADGEGAFSRDGGTLHLSFDLPLIGSTTLDELVEGKVIWVRSPLLNKHWIKFDAGKPVSVSGINLKLLTGVTPTAALALFQENEGAKAIGTDTVNGVSTNHYRVTLGMINQDVQYNSAEAWVDDQNLVRRVTLDFDAKISTTGNDKAHTVLTINYTDFGTAVTVTPPAADDVIDSSELSK